MNMDMVVKTSHIPQPGETVLGGTFFMNPGGKGANQAIAVARLGGEGAFIGKIGNDVFGKRSSQLFDEEGVDTKGMLLDQDTPSGIALITVDNEGENSIVVAPGANALLSPKDVEMAFSEYSDCKIILVQLEIPMETVEFTVRYAQKKKIEVVLNPAPANEDIKRFFHLIDIITPNINEAEMLSGIKIDNMATAKRAAEIIHEQGVKNVIITLGKKGAVLLENGLFHHIPAPDVETVDSTAAGDVFNGALTVALSEGKTLTDAISFACDAAAIAVTRLGAQSSIPYRNEVLLNNSKLTKNQL